MYDFVCFLALRPKSTAMVMAGCILMYENGIDGIDKHKMNEFRYFFLL